jgi:hypothetical protein
LASHRPPARDPQAGIAASTRSSGPHVRFRRPGAVPASAPLHIIVAGLSHALLASARCGYHTSFTLVAHCLRVMLSRLVLFLALALALRPTWMRLAASHRLSWLSVYLPSLVSYSRGRSPRAVVLPPRHSAHLALARFASAALSWFIDGYCAYAMPCHICRCWYHAGRTWTAWSTSLHALAAASHTLACPLSSTPGSLSKRCPLPQFDSTPLYLSGGPSSPSTIFVDFPPSVLLHSRFGGHTTLAHLWLASWWLEFLRHELPSASRAGLCDCAL